MPIPHDFRKTPFCCSKVIPQTPLHKYENYPRSYMCVFDFISLATSIPGHVPPSTLTKPLFDHDFVIRLCKGHSDLAFGPNQYGPARCYLPDSSILGGIVEVVDDPDGNPGRTSFEILLADLNFDMYVHLEDVWVTLLCPVHVDIVWFVQFWVRNARTEEELGEVTKRVRARRSGNPDFVEDEFTIRFNEMRGVPNPRPKFSWSESSSDSSTFWCGSWR
jgi:hypothetical protein